MNLAAQGDTWGITGPAFLVLYFTLLVGLLIISAIHRRILFAGDRRAPVSQLGPQQVAYLSGGDQLAVYAALGGLRGAGAIAGGPGKTLYQSGPMPAGVTPLDNAIYNAAGRRIRARDVTGDQWVVAAVRQLREGLEAQGLAVTPERLRAVRLGWGGLAAILVLLGVGRLVDGVQNDRPVGFLLVAVVLAVIVTMIMLTRRRRATHAADLGLRALRKQHEYLAPRHSPSFATYGATGAAMGVALYGTAALYTMDPAFAAEAEVQRINSTDSSSSGGDSGGSSSCSGGGSSCGGGGGCGGGGCGG